MKFDFIEKPYIPFAIIAIVGFLLFGQSLFFGYTYFDDDSFILNNTVFLKKPNAVTLSFISDTGGPDSISVNRYEYYRPLHILSFIGNYALVGVHPFLYHLTNLLLHIAVAWCAFLSLRVFMVAKNTALWLALFFLAHPAFLSVAVWIPARNESLLALCMLGGFLTFDAFYKKFSILTFGAHQLIFALALFSKETGIVLPILCVAYLIAIAKRRFALNWQHFAMVSCWGSIGGGWIFLRSYALGGASRPGFTEGLSVLMHNMPDLFIYIENVIFPFRALVYPIRHDFWLVPGIIIFVAFIIQILFIEPRKRRIILFGLFWFFILLMPNFLAATSGSHGYVPSYRMYPAGFGILIILSQITFFKKDTKWKNVLLGVVLCAFGALSMWRMQVYRDGERFWQAAVAASPKVSATHNGLGAYYYVVGDFVHAEDLFIKAARIGDPDIPYNYNLGTVYMQMKRYDKAEEFFQQEIKANPLYIKAYVNLGVFYYSTGDIVSAEKVWLKGLEVNPVYADLHNNLAYLYYQRGDLSHALEHARAVIEGGGVLREQVRALIEPYL